MAEPTVTGTAAAATEAATSATVVAATLLGAEATETKTTQQTEQPVVAAVKAEPTTETPATPTAETPEAKAAAAEAKPAEGAPDKYTFKAPEGTEYDANLLAAFEAGAKVANLPQEAAQKLLDQMAPTMQARQADQVAALKKDWYEASQTDTEFGGVHLEQNLGVAKQALDKFGTPALSKLLSSTGLGNHPEVIRFMYKAGQAISQDTFITGSAPARSQVKATSILYDKTKTQE